MGLFCLLVVVVLGTIKLVIEPALQKNQNTAPAETSMTTKESIGEESTSTTTEPSEDVSLDERIDQMTLEEKVGQVFLARVPETNQLEDIQNYHLGGYVLFGRDTENETAASLKEKITDYQAASKFPLLIAVDEEGGTVTRISRNPELVSTPFLSPQALYAAGGWDLIEADAIQKAEIFHEYGIHTGLFPVADVATDPTAFIYDRTIGMDASGTSKYVEITVKALQENNIGATLKHFPGYGNNRDSHVEIVTDERSLEELSASDFLPFEAGIAAGADSLLVSHNILASVDPDAPASISKAVHEIIRQQLGFDGVVMTDDMDMAGLADFISQEEAGLRALQAGNDLVMSSTYQQQIPFVLAAIQKGEYSEQELDHSVKRVLLWKEKLGLLG